LILRLRKISVKCLLLHCRKAKAQRLGLLLQYFVKIEKLTAQMTEIVVEGLAVVAHKNIFPNILEVFSAVV
jgi:hypothetical protein